MEPTLPPPLSGNPDAATMSLGARLMNVFAAPGDVFDEVKSSAPVAANWLAPVLMSCIVGVISVFVIFSQPGVQQQLREKQEQQLEKMVASGKLTAEQKQRAQAGMEGFSMTIVKISGSVGAVAASFGWVFAAALVLKLVSQYAFKSPCVYGKALEMAGLSGMISLLGGIVQTLLVVVTGSMFVSLGPALLLRDFDAGNKLHLFLVSLNLMTVWYVAVLSLGLSALSKASFGKAALWLFGLWIAVRAIVIVSGLGAGGM